MQTFIMTTTASSAVLAALMATAAHADTATTARVFGYQESQTGQFHALNHAVPDATTTPTTGTVEVTFNIKLVTAFAKGTTINCSIDVTGTAENTTAFTVVTYVETAGSPATISGSTATCTATLPYSWLIPAASTTEIESFSGGYTVSAYPAVTSTTTILTSAYRSSTSNFVSLKAVPASGTVSKYTVNVTL
jgi:uncharacterized Zn-binding protein involved in type VI secretion